MALGLETRIDFVNSKLETYTAGELDSDKHEDFFGVSERFQSTLTTTCRVHLESQKVIDCRLHSHTKAGRKVGDGEYRQPSCAGKLLV